MMNDSDRDRLDTLSARIARAEDAANPERKKEDGAPGLPNRAVLRAIRVGSDFVATVVVSTGLGWFADDQLGTGPWLMLLMLIIGFAVGFRMILKAFGDEDKNKEGPADGPSI